MRESLSGCEAGNHASRGGGPGRAGRSERRPRAAQVGEMVAEPLHYGGAEALLQHHSSGGAQRQSASGHEDHGAYLYLVGIEAHAAGMALRPWRLLRNHHYLSMR